MTDHIDQDVGHMDHRRQDGAGSDADADNRNGHEESLQTVAEPRSASEESAQAKKLRLAGRDASILAGQDSDQEVTSASSAARKRDRTHSSGADSRDEIDELNDSEDNGLSGMDAEQ